MAAALTGVTAVAFDVNGTLVHIRTDEHREDIFRAIGHFLTYQGIEVLVKCVSVSMSLILWT